MLEPGPREYLHPEVCEGIVVASPVAGVDSRVFTHVARAALRAGGASGVARAVTPEGFAQLRAELVLDLVECPDCGQFLTGRGLGTHRATNIACRWGRAVAAVRQMWAEDRRDPWSVPGAPLDWGGLRAKAVWRRRLELVRFPRWTAVLLAPSPVAAAGPTPAVAEPPAPRR